jgi:hypothetical protein
MTAGELKQLAKRPIFRRRPFAALRAGFKGGAAVKLARKDKS